MSRPTVAAKPRPLAGTVGEHRAAVLAAVMRGLTTYPELVAATGLAKSNVHHHLEALRADGWVTWERGHAGTLRARFVCAWPEYMLEA